MWRNTALPVRVLMLDARACLPVLCFFVYWSWLTFYIAVIGMTFFSVISFFGLTLPAVVRLVRRFLIGSTRPAVPAWNRRRLV
jgi:intracellular multiplication protein IcmT